jgi:hypothetical protein
MAQTRSLRKKEKIKIKNDQFKRLRYASLLLSDRTNKQSGQIAEKEETPSSYAISKRRSGYNSLIKRKSLSAKILKLFNKLG